MVEFEGRRRGMLTLTPCPVSKGLKGLSEDGEREV